MAKTPTLRIIPLGGLDGIGKNMTAFACGDDAGAHHRFCHVSR